MLEKKQIEIYHILQANILCCFTVITLSIVIQAIYIISGIVVLSSKYSSNEISIYNLSSILFCVINIFSYVIFYTFNNKKFKLWNLFLFLGNCMLFFTGVILLALNGKINESSIVAICGTLVHFLITCIHIAIMSN